MGKNIRMIYLADELNSKLKEEENASALIVSLLEKHYKYKEQNQLTAQQRLDLFREQKEKNLDPLLTQEEQLMNEVEREQEEKIKYEYLKQKEIDKEQNKKNTIFNTFKEEVGREMTEKEYQELLRRYKEEPKFNLFRFIDEHKEVLNGERT
jgi:hypothetical protein